MLGSGVFVRACHNGILKFAHKCYRNVHLVYEWLNGGCDVCACTCVWTETAHESCLSQVVF